MNKIKMKENISYAVKFIFEMGILRMVSRTGWGLLNIPLSERENVSEHTLRAAQIGYILALLENYPDPNKISTILIFHDSHETRTWDPNKVMRRYMDVNEKKAAQEQYSGFSEEIYSQLQASWDTIEEQSTTAGVIAKDADILECAFTAKEYIEKGYQPAEEWIKNAKDKLKTKSAKKLIKEMIKSNSKDWWKDLKQHNY